METPYEIALLVIKKDDTRSNEKIQSIRNLMMCARMTEEGVLNCEREIRFYESQKHLNKQLINAGNESLIVLNAITIVSKVLWETDVPSRNNEKEIEDYKKIVNKYSRYLEILSLNSLETSRMGVSSD